MKTLKECRRRYKKAIDAYEEAKCIYDVTRAITNIIPIEHYQRLSAAWRQINKWGKLIGVHKDKVKQRGE